MSTTDSSTLIYSELGADPDLGELVDMFVAEMPDRMQALQQSHNDGNAEELGRLAHQIKGAAGSYGFHQLTPQAARLERAVKDNQPEDEVLRSLEELMQMCSQIRAGAPTA